MRTVIFIFTIILLSVSCHKELMSGKSRKCEDLLIGKVEAKSNYIDIKGYAWIGKIAKDSLFGLVFQVGENVDGCCCYYDRSLSVFFKTITKDTIFLDKRCIYNELQNDAAKELYTLMQQKNYKSWVKIDKINKDTSEVEGTFDLGYLIDDTKRKFDPKIPDTIFLKNGIFIAKKF